MEWILDWIGSSLLGLCNLKELTLQIDMSIKLKKKFTVNLLSVNTEKKMDSYKENCFFFLFLCITSEKYDGYYFELISY